jgi:hypothetical protein
MRTIIAVVSFVALLVPLGPSASAIDPPCTGTWVIDEPDGISGVLTAVDIAPDGTVIAAGRDGSQTLILRRSTDGVWQTLPPLPSGPPLLAGAISARSADDIEVVMSLWNPPDQPAHRLAVWRYDGSSWVDDETAPDRELFLDHVVWRGADLAIAGWVVTPDGSDAAIVRRTDGVWSTIRSGRLPKPEGLRSIDWGGVAIGAGGRLWVAYALRDQQARRSIGFLADATPSGGWRGRELPVVATGDIDIADGTIAVSGYARGPRVLVGRPGAWREMRVSTWQLDQLEMLTPSSIWLSTMVHFDARGVASEMPLRRRPDAPRWAWSVAEGPDGDVWAVGQTSERQPEMAVEHLCPWMTGDGPLDPRIVTTTAPATGVVWRVPDGAGTQILVDRSPFRLFDEVLTEGESLSITYPGAGRYQVRDVTSGRNAVVAVAPLAYRRHRDPSQIIVWIAAPHQYGFGEQAQVQGPDDDSFRPIASGYTGGALVWAFDQGPGEYRFRARMVGPDGTTGDWSPVRVVDIV